MFKPQTISEQMMFTTARLQTSVGSGTGFFFNFNLGTEGMIPIIITNKHVLNYNQSETVQFFLHTKTGGNPDGQININFQTEWHFHPDKDLCFCFLGPLFNQIKEKENKDVFFLPITEDLVWDNSKLDELSAIEDVVMVGYPNGLWDKQNNLPLFRRGITASHPATDFNNKNIGVVDMACFPGSSGSPIFILNENGYSDKKGTHFMGSSRVILLGVLFEGPQMNAKGELIIENIPTQQKISPNTPLLINLGYYVKANELMAFKEIIKNLITKNK